MELKKEAELSLRTSPLDSEISVTPFKFKHLPLLSDMLESNKFPHLTDISMKTLPKIGYIALLSGQPVAAGFLRRIEGGYAQIDTLASNPFFGSKLRHEGLNLIVKSLIEDAKALDLKAIISFTSDEGVLTRAKSIGFKETHQKLIALSLSDYSPHTAT